EQVFHILAHIAGFGERGSVADGEGHVENPRQRPSQERFTAAGRTDEQDVALVHLDVAVPLVAKAQALVMIVHRDGKDLLGAMLADHILVELVLEVARRGDVREKGLGNSPAAFFLIDDGLAELDTFTTNIDVARSFDQRADIPVALATKRTISIAVAARA